MVCKSWSVLYLLKLRRKLCSPISEARSWIHYLIYWHAYMYCISKFSFFQHCITFIHVQRGDRSTSIKISRNSSERHCRLPYKTPRYIRSFIAGYKMKTGGLWVGNQLNFGNSSKGEYINNSPSPRPLPPPYFGCFNGMLNSK